MTKADHYRLNGVPTRGIRVSIHKNKHRRHHNHIVVWFACHRAVQSKPPRNADSKWKLLVKLEPRLGTLYRQARAVRDDKTKRSFCADHVWSGQDERGLFHQLYRLVGWGAAESSNPTLKTSAAYDLACRLIQDALPECRNCIHTALWEEIEGRRRRRKK